MQNLVLSGRQLALDPIMVAIRSGQFHWVTLRFTTLEKVRQRRQRTLPLGFRVPFGDAGSLKFLNATLESASVEFPKAVGQSADKYASDQSFARFVQVTCTARVIGCSAEAIRNI